MKFDLRAPRAPFLMLAVLAWGGLAVALYLEHGLGLLPCPLCIFQRVALLMFALWVSLAAVHGRWLRTHAALALLSAGVGAAIAGRHVWLQQLPPDQVPACGPGLDYWLEALPMTQVVQLVLTGSGECAALEGAWLGLSLPGWTLLMFVVLMGLTAPLLRRRSAD